MEVRGRLLYEDGKAVGVRGIARNVTERKRVEQQVRLQEAALEFAAIGIVITDREGNILWVNAAFTALSGYPLEEAIGKNPRLLKSGRHDAEFYRDMWKTIRTGQVWRGEIVNRRKDGTFYDEELTITPVCSTSGEITNFVALGQDISARKQAEEARGQLAAIVESSNDAIMGISRQGLILSWNRGAEVLYGYHADEILGEPVSILAPPDVSDEIPQLVKLADTGERVVNYETVRVAKDGRRVAVSLSMSPIKNARGEVAGSAAIARDITQRRQAEEALRQSEEKYRSIVLNIPDVVWTIDSRRRVVFISPNIEKLGGFTAEEVRANGLEILFETMHPGDVQSMLETLSAAFRDRQPREVEYRSRCKDGRWIWLRARTTGSYEKDGVQYLQGLLSDVTERKRAEEELALLKHSIDVYCDGAYWTDVNDRIFYVNDAGCKALGYTREELMGKAMGEVIPAASPEMLKRVWESLRHQGFAWCEAVHRRKDGSEFPVELVITYVQFSGREFACGFARDVTERRNFASRLRLQSAALEAADNGIVIIARDGSILWVNPGFSTLTGYPSKEAIGKNLRIIESDQQPPVVYKDLWETVQAGNVWHGEITNRRKDGTLYEEEMTITPVRESDLVKVIVKALDTGWNGNITPKISGSPQEPGCVLRVLLAESNEVTQVLVTHLLAKRGHQVFVAADGLQVVGAVGDAQAQGFDVVLMDTRMPGMSGLEAARIIREIERKTGRRTPIIAMTGNPTPGEEEACTAAGIDAYLAKPLRPSALFESIQRVRTPQDPTSTVKDPPPMVFDKATFLSRLEGDELLCSEVIKIFLQEYPKLLHDVQHAAAQGNASLLERAAHALKGSVGDLAAPQAFDAARVLEQMAREGKLEGAGAALESLETALDQLEHELRNLENKAA